MEYRTKSGKVLTDDDIQALADEAERGYDIAHLRPLTDAERERLQELVGSDDPKS